MWLVWLVWAGGYVGRECVEVVWGNQTLPSEWVPPSGFVSPVLIGENTRCRAIISRSADFAGWGEDGGGFEGSCDCLERRHGMRYPARPLAASKAGMRMHQAWRARVPARD